MSRASLLLVWLLLASSAALAQRPWYYPASAHKSYVNPYLTPQRAIGERSWQARFEGQLVLWVGTAQNVRGSHPQSLQLRTQAGRVPVQFSRMVKNLQADREGAMVAVKGFLRRTPAGNVYLEGRSVIPWRPAGGYNRESELVEQWVDFSRPELSPMLRQRIAQAIGREASARGIDPLLLTALIQVESGFDPDAVSPSGAQGLGQLMPFTARELGVQATDVEDNIRGCAQMIGGLLDRYSHRSDGPALALASYNAGPNLVARIQRVPPYEQTVNYVYFIGSLHAELQRHKL